MENLNAFTRRSFTSDQHILFNAGLIDQNGIPTSKGKEEMTALLWEKNLKELVKVSEQILSQVK